MGQKSKKNNCRSELYWGMVLGVPIGILIIMLIATGASYLSAGSAGRGRSTLAWSDNIASEPGTPTMLGVTLLGSEQMDNLTITAHLVTTIEDNGEPLYIHDDLPGFRMVIPREDFEQVQLYGEDDFDSITWEGVFTIERSDMENQELFEDVDFASLTIMLNPWSRDEDGVLTRYMAKSIDWVFDLRDVE